MSFLDKIFRKIATLLCGQYGAEQQHSPPTQQQGSHQPQAHKPPVVASPPPATEQPHHYPPQTQPQPPAHRPPQKHTDANQANQNNEQYQSLRARANEEGDKMAQCFQRSHEAYEAKDGAGAKELSNQGKAHQQAMERLNTEASEWIFNENNKDSSPGEIDLHGLYVKEAIHYTDRAINEAKQRRDSQLRLIVGKGLHSKGGAAKIKPAVEELMQKHQLVAELDPENSGVLVVQIDAGGQRGVGSDEIARRLSRDDEGCTIM